MSSKKMSKDDVVNNEMEKPIHLLIFPFPSSGHIIPLLDLTRRLLTRHPRHLFITFLVTPPSIPLLQPLLDSFPPSTLQPLILSPPSLYPTRGGLISKIRALNALSDQIISWFRSHPSPPHAIVTDFFLGWTHSLSSTLGLPRVVFYPSGAFSCSVLNSMWRDVPDNPDGDNNLDFEVRFDDIPGSPRFKWFELSMLFRTGKAGDPEWELFREDMMSNVTSWGAVFNSFSELESVYFDHFKKEMGCDRVWAVGPLLPDDVLAQRGEPSSVPVHEVLTWLDGKPDWSVVYVCFGSRTSLTVDQAAVLGEALECSKVNFIWCVGKSDGTEEGTIMPDEKYVDRMAVSGRGFIIRGWAPQLGILRHRAIASFLTHCGWNSTLEMVSSGVMSLAWPMGADQYANAELIVGQLGLGLQVKCHGPGNGVPDPCELAQLLVESVSPGRPERTRVMKLREAAAMAVSGGSSTADLDDFVKRLSELKK